MKNIIWKYYVANIYFYKKKYFENNKFNTDKEIAGSEDYLFWLNLSKKFKIYGLVILHPLIILLEDQ